MEDLDLIMISAFRYALGRNSYMPSTVADFIKANIDVLRISHRQLIIYEIEQAERGDYGYSLGNYDDVVKTWLDLKEFLKGTIK